MKDVYGRPAIRKLAATLDEVLAGVVTARGYEWVSAGAGAAEVHAGSAVFGGGLFLGACTLPVVAKWLVDMSYVHDVVRVRETDTVRMCRGLAHPGSCSAARVRLPPRGRDKPHRTRSRRTTSHPHGG